MASLSAESLFLAGFTLAHAAWSVSDTTSDELLCPLAVFEKDGERRLLRFEAETQEQAIRAMKEAMARSAHAGEAFAAAREGAWRPSGPDTDPEDVLTVDFWSPGMDAPISTLQPFRRAQGARGFALLGAPMLLINGAIVRPDDAAPAVEVLLQGVHSHSGVQPLWHDWQSS
jgi:hypothetical protein